MGPSDHKQFVSFYRTRNMIELLVLLLRLLVVTLVIGGAAYVGTIHALDVYFDDDKDSVFVDN